jgi:cytochrome d ubiquinol oxidase subunit II
MIDLNTLWFILIAVLFCGFFFLEGIDFGVGMLSKILGKNDLEKRMIISTIGPIWNSNEVWLLTAGGAIFAAFPGWYATMFSGLYLALFLVLVALIFRGIAIEFRNKVNNQQWRAVWDWSIFIGSLLSPLLIAVAMANLLKGLPIDSSKEYVGNFFNLLSIPTLVAGLTAVVTFIYHGLVFLSLKLSGELKDRAQKLSKPFGLASLLFIILSLILVIVSTDVLSKTLPTMFAVVTLLSIVVSLLLQIRGKSGLAMIANSLLIIGGGMALFSALYPNVMVSSIDKTFNLTIYNVSSTPYTLKIMSFIALSILPLLLSYIAWTYWVFRKRKPVESIPVDVQVQSITTAEHTEY